MKNIVPFYRAIAGLPLERQHEACRETARKLGTSIAIEYTADEHGGDLAEWRRVLRSTDIAIVANLLCIPDWCAKGARPGSVLAETLTELSSRGVMIMSALDEVSSADGARWVALVRAAHDALAMGGRKLPRKKAQAMARKSHEKRRPGAVRRWTSPAMKAVRDRWAAVWRDPVHINDAAALAAMSDDVQSDIRSVSSARRIFGRRTPNDKRAGGRPRKSKPKTK